ncbi:hypothetical protein FRC16_010863 [Serendipita sp. 398]|nr:hypothetical protein FRC16_010863 [Serendipita sp. 398]
MTETEETNHPSPFDGPDVHEILQAFLDTDTQVLLKDTIAARNTATVKSIDELFRTVEGKLESIDQKRSQIWMVFRRRYTRCVSKSRRIATDIGLAAEKYLNFIVRPAARYYEQGSISREDLEEFDFEVQDLLLENKRCMEEAETLESEFSNLQSEIKTFRDGLTAIEPSEEIDAPTQALAALKVELNSIRRNLATAKWAALFGGGIGIFGALLALTAWCPPVAGIVLAFGGAALLGSAGAAAYYKYKESRMLYYLYMASLS